MATKDFKYINKENYLDFVLGMSDKVDQILEDPIILDFFNRGLVDHGKAIPPANERSEEDTLKLAESFLHLMVDYEEYEQAQIIIDNYPELRNNC
mgnify:CR=1 FL=1|tara:strand:+ start:91 stop:375 length:285 start_codon:yes stop_codon:yes gene_type:complete